MGTLVVFAQQGFNFEGALGGAVKGGIIGAIVGLAVWCALQIGKRFRK